MSRIINLSVQRFQSKLLFLADYAIWELSFVIRIILRIVFIETLVEVDNSLRWIQVRQLTNPFEEEKMLIITIKVTKTQCYDRLQLIIFDKSSSINFINKVSTLVSIVLLFIVCILVTCMFHRLYAIDNLYCYLSIITLNPVSNIIIIYIVIR